MYFSFCLGTFILTSPLDDTKLQIYYVSFEKGSMPGVLISSVFHSKIPYMVGLATEMNFLIILQVGGLRAERQYSQVFAKGLFLTYR